MLCRDARSRPSATRWETSPIWKCADTEQTKGDARGAACLGHFFGYRSVLVFDDPGDGEPHRYRGAFSELALDLQISAMEFGQALRVGQSQATAATYARIRRFDLLEGAHY